jgi:hypothetical protein
MLWLAPPRDGRAVALAPNQETMSSRRVLIVAIVVVAVLAGFFLLRSAPPPKPPPPAPRASATPESVAVAPAPTASPVRLVQRTETYLEPVDESQLAAKQAAARYRKAARYPRTSWPLENGIDPIAKSRMPAVDNDWKGKERQTRLLAYPSLTIFEAPGDIVIYGEVVELHQLEKPPERDSRGDRGPNVRQTRVPATSMRGVIQTADGVQVATIEFRDDGTKGDAQAGDYFFTATYTPDPDRPDDFRGDFQVIVLAETEKGEEVSATTGFTYSVQKAHLTGQYRDSIVQGNLQIEGEVEVEETGRFVLKGTLAATADAKMVGFGKSEVVELTPGTHWIPMTYYGLMFHDMKADGPYTLFSVVLATRVGTTESESDVVPNAHTTAAYKVSDFGDQPFNDPEMMQKAADAERRG